MYKILFCWELNVQDTVKHTFFLLELGHYCYWWDNIKNILFDHYSHKLAMLSFPMMCKHANLEKRTERRCGCERWRTVAESPDAQVTWKGHVKQGQLFFYCRMSVKTTDTTFFCKNPALLRLTTQLYLPPLLFTLSSRQYFTFTEDSNTRLSGSTQGAIPGLKVQTPGSQLLDWCTHEHPGSCQSLCFCFVSRNQFLLLGSFWLPIKKLNLNYLRQNVGIYYLDNERLQRIGIRLDLRGS